MRMAALRSRNRRRSRMGRSFRCHPVGFEPSWDWFGPAETSSYGNGPRAKVGFFASYERLYWSFAKPAASEIGSPTASFAVSLSGLTENGVNTGWLTAAGGWGNRWEFGYVDTDNYGWLVSVLDRVSQGQHSVAENALVQFDDPNNLLSGFLPSVDPVTGLIIDSDLNNNNVHGRSGLDLGRPNPLPPPPIFVPPPDGHPDTPAPTDFGDRIQWPVIYSLLDMKNITRLNGVEIMRMYRAPRLHYGGYFELLYGVRYLQLDDAFKVYGTNSVTNVSTDIFTGVITSNSFVDLTNPLADSQWSQRAQNNMIGSANRRTLVQSERTLDKLVGSSIPGGRELPKRTPEDDVGHQPAPEPELQHGRLQSRRSVSRQQHQPVSWLRHGNPCPRHDLLAGWRDPRANRLQHYQQRGLEIWLYRPGHR